MISIKPYSSIEDRTLIKYVDEKYINKIKNVAKDQIMIMYENSDFMGITIFDTQKGIGIIKFQEYRKDCNNYLMRDGMVKATLNAIYIKGYLDAYILSSNEDLSVNIQIGLSEVEDKDSVEYLTSDVVLYARLPDFFEKGCHSYKK